MDAEQSSSPRMTLSIRYNISYIYGIAFLFTIVSSQDTTPNCTTICPDDLTFPDPALNDEVLFVQEGVNITCGIYQSSAARGKFSELECQSASYLGVNSCGCGFAEPFCQLCEDGSIPPDLTFEASPPFTCLDLAGFASDADTGSGMCTAAQAVDGFYCGCENPSASAGACRLCTGTNPLPDPSREVLYRGSVVACSFVEYSANVSPADQCPEFQSIGAACCSTTPSPTIPPNDNPACNVCGEEGVKPGYPGVVPDLPGFGEFNCSSLYEYGLGGYVKVDDCRLLQLTVPSTCGCGEEPLAPTQSPTSSLMPTTTSTAGQSTSVPLTPEPTPTPEGISTEMPTSPPTTSGAQTGYQTCFLGYTTFAAMMLSLALIV